VQSAAKEAVMQNGLLKLGRSPRVQSAVKGAVMQNCIVAYKRHFNLNAVRCERSGYAEPIAYRHNPGGVQSAVKGAVMQNGQDNSAPFGGAVRCEGSGHAEQLLRSSADL